MRVALEELILPRIENTFKQLQGVNNSSANLQCSINLTQQLL